MIEVLKIIAAKSPAARRDAVKTIQAIGANSPAVQQRYQFTVDATFNDPQADFTQDEYALIASFLETTEPESRTKTIVIRVSPSEYGDITRMAEDNGMTVADWTRQLWGLG